MISRGGIFWADLGGTSGSRPAKRRPVLVVQSDPYNSSRLATVNKSDLTDPVGALQPRLMHEVDRGLHKVLKL